MFYCLYVPDARYYNNLIVGAGGGRLSDFEKKRKAVKSALGNCKSIRLLCAEGKVKECGVCRVSNGNWYYMECFEVFLFDNLLHDSHIKYILNLDGETTYNVSHKTVWNELNALAHSALDKTTPKVTVRSGVERASHTKQLAANLKPLYKFIIEEGLSSAYIIAYPSKYILNLFNIKANEDLLEQYIARGT